MSDEEEDMICDLPSDAPTKTSNAGDLRKQLLSKKGLPPAPRPPRGAIHDNSILLWDKFFDEKREIAVNEDTFNVYLKGKSGPIFYLLHGGGYSGLTWACFTEQLTSSIDCRILAPDLRGHGDTKCEDEADLSTERQVADIISIFEKIYDYADDIDVCIIGHSMGGALAIHTAASHKLRAKISGLVVIDVVEGSAMEALGGMVHFLHSRPSIFESPESAIDWCIRSGTVRNRIAARISMPSQIRQISENEYGWRIDLTKTEQYWKGWFQGLSAKFLACPVPKLLVLAGVDRLDRDLTIGQMQGKFQTCVLPRVGHCVQEDSPDHLAEELTRFALRYQFAQKQEFHHFSSPADL
ncbi:unnamed protein product [Caenorhabditis angaria]|uniref:Protein phosphatase methylesterase 1 n=1 Tax=Caenorhabditis angaria TaxID=860376 RepID=A0A9P1IKW8_9PELO|nr:unnamed protein product [Caenorhabditis angaria]